MNATNTTPKQPYTAPHCEMFTAPKLFATTVSSPSLTTKEYDDESSNLWEEDAKEE